MNKAVLSDQSGFFLYVGQFFDLKGKLLGAAYSLFCMELILFLFFTLKGEILIISIVVLS